MFNYRILISSIIFLILDFLFLGLMKNYFNYQVKLIQGTPLKANLFGALLSYLFLLIGLNYFIIIPKKNVSDAFLLGLIIYGVFDATNYAMFKEYLITTLIIDTLWGGILFASTTYLTSLIS